MIDKKIKILSILCAVSFLFLFSLMVTQSNKQEKLVQASSNISLSNQKIGWGIKREKDHMQPNLGAKNEEIINKYEGMAIGNKEKKYVYLTFDEGYEAGYTPKILEVLKENNVKATFFITAHYVNTQPDLVKQMIEERTYCRKSYS